jgi:hypothetical protein
MDVAFDPQPWIYRGDLVKVVVADLVNCSMFSLISDAIARAAGRSACYPNRMRKAVAPAPNQ